MRAHESVNERVGGGRDAGNDCEVPRAASSVERSTRPATPQANAPVTATQSPTSDALLAPSARQAPRLRSFFSLLPQLDAGQPGMGHHREGDVPIPAVSEAHLILIEARLSFGLFDALLHRVAAGGDPNLRRQ